MGKLELLWAVKLDPKAIGAILTDLQEDVLMIRAQTCDEQNGSLIFKGGDHSAIKVIIAPGQWAMVEREEFVNENAGAGDIVHVR